MYAVYQFLQGIVNEVFTGVNMFGHTVKFLTTSISDFSKEFEAFQLPSLVSQAFTVVIALALIDKLRKRG